MLRITSFIFFLLLIATTADSDMVHVSVDQPVSWQPKSLFQNDVEKFLAWPNGLATNADTNLWFPQINDSLWSTQDSMDCIGDSGLQYSNALHPSVCKFDNGFGEKGWKYVMAYTPICKSDKDENPHIAVSFDGIHWFTPYNGVDSAVIFADTDSAYAVGFRDSTLDLPLYYPSDFGGMAQDYTSDCDIFEVGDSIVYLAFRLTKDLSPRDSNFILMTHSYDLVNWFPVDTLLADTESFMSPSFVPKEDGSIRMWCVEIELNGIQEDTSMVTLYVSDQPSGPYTLIDTVSFFSNPGRDVWHLNVFDNGLENLLALVVEDTVDGMFGGAGVDFSLYCAYSKDGGRSFTTHQSPLLRHSGSGWDENFIYRTDGVWTNNQLKDSLEMFYSASGQGGWHIGRTFALFYACCEIRGDCDHNGVVDISDLTYLVDYMFRNGPSAVCIEESDTDSEGVTNISDLTYLVDYMFRDGPTPGDC